MHFFRVHDTRRAKKKGAAHSPLFVLSVVVIPFHAIQSAGTQATILETTSGIRMGTDHCGQVSRINSLSPWTTRYPRLTCVSDGYPRRRLLVRSKKPFVLALGLSHDTPPCLLGPNLARTNYTYRLRKVRMLLVISSLSIDDCLEFQLYFAYSRAPSSRSNRARAQRWCLSTSNTQAP